MKNLLLWLPVFMSTLIFGQPNSKIENIIIITTDGLRWQEVFKGMDSVIASNPSFNQKDSPGIYTRYWASTPEERRKKLLPFLWNTLVPQGQIYGNRAYGANVDNANPYWFSYPGYSEIFCGFVDTAINTNAYPPNPHTNVLEYLNQQPSCKNKVAAFCAWSAFDNVLNEKRSGFPVICGPDACGGEHPDAEQQLLNKMKLDAYSPFGYYETPDLFTHYMAVDYLKKNKPRVLYIGYGETDSWAHQAHYKDYLNAAHQVDKWLSDLWNFIQNDPQYKNKTALFITVDHGRGDANKDQWTSHNQTIPDAHEIWFAVIGPDIPARGEIKSPVQLYQQQYANTFAELMGMNFICEHPVSVSLIDILLKSPRKESSK